MGRKSEIPLEKATLRFFQGDLARLDQYHPQSGHNAVVRMLVRKYLRQLDQRAATGLAKIKTTEVELDPDTIIPDGDTGESAESSD